MEKSVERNSENLVDNLSEQEALEIKAGIKSRLGINVDISNVKVAPDYIENGILDLLNKERESKSASYEHVWIRAFLVDKKRLVRKGTKMKLRLKTIWFDREGQLHQDAEDRKLSSYDGVPAYAAKFVGDAFCDIMVNFQEGNPDKIPTIKEASIFFQFDISTGDPIVKCNFVRGSDPRNVIEEIELSNILK